MEMLVLRKTKFKLALHVCFVISHVRLFVTLWTAACQFLCSWDFSGKSTGVVCHFLLQGIFPVQGLNLHLLCLLNWQTGILPTKPPGKPPNCWIKGFSLSSIE